MVKIDRIYPYRMRNDEHFQFHTEFRSLVVKHGAAALKIKPEFDAYLLLYEREDEALKKIVKSGFTAKIRDADKARDSTYIGMAETNKTAIRRSNPAVRDAALRLKILFDTYGRIARKTMNEETSAIYNLLKDLQGRYVLDVATVGIGGWVEELKARSEAFETLMASRFDETTARTSIVLKDARSEIDALYSAIRSRINALVLVEGAAAYEPFIKSLNTVIAKYAVKHRHHSLSQDSNVDLQGGI